MEELEMKARIKLGQEKIIVGKIGVCSTVHKS